MTDMNIDEEGNASSEPRTGFGLPNIDKIMGETNQKFDQLVQILDAILDEIKGLRSDITDLPQPLGKSGKTGG